MPRGDVARATTKPQPSMQGCAAARSSNSHLGVCEWMKLIVHRERHDLHRPHLFRDVVEVDTDCQRRVVGVRPELNVLVPRDLLQRSCHEYV